MDNLTHSLVGLTAAKAGLEKLSPGATTLCVLAANAPDSDIIALLFGRWTFLHHHRGITHSILGAAVLAVALPAVFCLVDWIIARAQNRELHCRFLGLLFASVLTTATHPLLDWTNNYGMRFFLPWNPKWSYGDFAFVIDPFIWMLLGSAAFLVTSKTRRTRNVWIIIALATSYLVLVSSSSQSRPGSLLGLRVLWVIAIAVCTLIYRRRGAAVQTRKVAAGALVVATLYLFTLAGLHIVALRQARTIAADLARMNAEQEVDVAAMATLGNPFNWNCILETDRATYRFNVSLLRQQAENTSARFARPSGIVAVAVTEAERDYRAQVLSEFMRFPGYRLVGQDCATQTIVQFADLRYTEPGKRSGTFSLDVPIECPLRPSD